MFRKLFSHTAIYGFAPQVTRVASVLSLPIITQHLSSTDFGVYGLVTAVAGAIAVFNTLGLRIILVNLFYKSPHQFKWGWRQIYGFLLVWNLPYSLILSGILWLFIPAEAIQHRLAIILINVIPLVLFGPSSIIGTTYFQLKQKPLQIALRATIFGLLTVLLNIYCISVLKLGYMGWFISTGITTLLNQASYYLPVNFTLGLKPIFNFKWRFIKKSLATSLPTVPHYYAGYLLDSSDRVIMKTVGVSTSDIGLYNAAYTAGNLFKQFGTASGYALGPMMNAAYKAKDDIRARNLVFCLQTFYFLVTFLCAIWLKEIFYFILRNESLQVTYPIGIIILMGYNYRPMYFGANNKLFYEEKTKNLLKVTFIAGILNVILNFTLIPIFGYKAAAYTTFVSLMYMGYSGYYLSVFKKINSANYYPLLWLLITVLLTVGAYFLVEFSVVFKGAISIMAGFFCFYFIRRFSN